MALEGRSWELLKALGHLLQLHIVLLSEKQFQFKSFTKTSFHVGTKYIDRTAAHCCPSITLHLDMLVLKPYIFINIMRKQEQGPVESPSKPNSTYAQQYN